jgi:chemotaxis protein MotB
MRRKKEDEHENLERWLITYSDLITLLLAFFIMMYTFSKQDAQKYQEVSERLRAIFTGGVGILKTGASVNSKSVITLPPTVSAGKDVEKQLEKEVQSMADSVDPEHRISVFRDERGIVIRIMDRAFFDEGNAHLKETAKQALSKIVPIIESSDSPIRVEGHTDNVPIKTSEFGSNWELSVRRATEVVRHLIEKHEFPPERISASGYAEYRPVAPNDTAQNRALNRRIEIILLQPSAADPLKPPPVNPAPAATRTGPLSTPPAPQPTLNPFKSSPGNPGPIHPPL